MQTKQDEFPNDKMQVIDENLLQFDSFVNRYLIEADAQK